MFAVCRGRVSEGLDFKDELCRCVIVVSPPLANFFDPKIMLKQNYLNFKKLTYKDSTSNQNKL